MSNAEMLIQAAKSATEIRLLALDRALRIFADPEQGIKTAKLFEAYLNGETV